MFCKQCGKEIINNEKFCSECGAAVDDNKLSMTSSQGKKKIISTSTPPKKKTVWPIILVVLFFVFAIGIISQNGSTGTEDLSSDSSSVASDEIIIKHSMEEVNITQEFASEMQDKTNRLVVETLQLAGDNIKVCPKNECTCITAGENLLSFYTAVAQGIDTYLCRADWVKEDKDWTVTFLEINGEVIFNY